MFVITVNTLYVYPLMYCMEKLITLTLLLAFILTGSTFAFAKSSNSCAIALSSSSDNRIHSLSVEDQDMIIISSIIASQLQTSTEPIKISPTIMLLSAFTEVKVNRKDQSIFHNLSLIDQTLFTIFKDLGILKNLQDLLLSQLGLSSNDLGPFSIREDGGLTLYLDTPPSVSTVIDFNFNETVNRLLDNFIRFRENKQRTSQSMLTFSGYFFLVALSLDTPILTLLSYIFDTRDPKKIRSILYKLFNDIKQQRFQAESSPKQKAIIQKTIQFFQEKGMTIAEAARRLDIHEHVLRGVIKKYEKIYGRIPGRQSQSPNLSTKEQEEIVKKSIPFFQEKNMTIPKAAKKLGIEEVNNFKRWLYNYEKKYGRIFGRQLQPQNLSTKKPEEIIQEVIQLFKEKDMTIVEAARRLGKKKTTLQKLIYKYEKEHGRIHGRQLQPNLNPLTEEEEEIVKRSIPFFQEENMTMAKAARRLGIEKVGDFKALVYKYEKEHGRIPGRHLRPQSLSIKEQEEVIQRVIQFFQEKGMTIAEAARRLAMHRVNLQKLIYKYEKEHGRIPGR